MLSFEERLTQRLRVMQIIAGALLASVAVFGVVSIVLVKEHGPFGGTDAEDALPILSIVAWVMLAGSCMFGMMWWNRPMLAVVERIAARPDPRLMQQPHVTDDTELLAVRQVSMIVSLALLEAAGNMACIAYLIEGQSHVLVAVGVTVLLMLWQFPTRERVRAWLERHLAIIQELRDLGGP
jgi:hypothetical protein